MDGTYGLDPTCVKSRLRYPQWFEVSGESENMEESGPALIQTIMIDSFKHVPASQHYHIDRDIGMLRNVHTRLLTTSITPWC